MPINMSLTGNLNGISTIAGQVGPTSINYPLNAATQFETKEIPVPVASPAAVFTFPTIATQTLFYLTTTQDVTLIVNSEPSGLLKAGGVYIRCGMAPITQISLAGNMLTAGVVYVVAVGA
jgi:hypothetical protein